MKRAEFSTELKLKNKLKSKIAMASTNNLKGHIVKDGRVIYSEQIKDRLYLKVILKYEPFYDGKNKMNHQNSSQIMIETVVTDGSTHNWSNGVHSFIEKIDYEEVKKGKIFRELTSFKTKSGITIKEIAYRFGEKEDEKGVKYNTRYVVTIAIIEKSDLIKMCSGDFSF